MPYPGLGGDIERVCSKILVHIWQRMVSLRSAIEDAEPRVPRSLLNATCLGVLRNYKLVERMLHMCGYRISKRFTEKYWLEIIGGYEAAFRDGIVSIERIVSKTNLPRRVARCMRLSDPDDAVSGIRDVVRRLAVRYSIPRWAVEELAKLEVPGGLEALLKSFQVPTPLWLRVNTNKISVKEAIIILKRRYGIEAVYDEALHDMVMVGSLRPGALNELPRSLFYPEDRTPAAAVHMLRSILNDYGEIIDYFSAPGNKVAHLSWVTPVTYFIGLDASHRRLNNEVYLHELQGIRYRGDYVVGLAEHPPFRSGARAAIVDPDCTSMGRLGHSPETRLFLERVGRSLLHRLVAVQKKGLYSALSSVKRGGYVLYTTCTLTLAENEKVVEAFTNEGIAEPVVEAETTIGVEGYIRGSRRFYPHLVNATGGFAVVLRRIS